MYDIYSFPGSTSIFGKASIVPFYETALGKCKEGHYQESDFTASQSLMQSQGDEILLYFSPSDHQSVQNVPLMGIWGSHLSPPSPLLSRPTLF